MLAAVTVGASISTATPALAHESADVQITSPTQGGEADDSLDVVLTAVSTGGDIGFANFTLSLDGRAVDQNGKVGSAFTSLGVAAGETLTVPLRSVAAGSHELRVKYAADPDSAPKPDVVRTFTVTSSDSRSIVPAIAVGAVFVALIAASVVLRRRAARQVRPAAKRPAPERAKKPATTPVGAAARSNKPHPRKRSRR